MRPLPNKFRRHAASIAAMNPLAFTDVDAAEKSLARCHHVIASNGDTTAVTTAGFMFKKDSDGDIELWVSPDVLWGRSDGKS